MRVTRWLAWGAGTLVVCALLLAGLVTTAVQTEWGSQVLWNTASRWASGQLSGELVGGNLSDGLRLRNVVYQDAALRVRVDKLESSWHLQLSPLKLSVQNLRLGIVDLTLLPGPAKAIVLPSQLTLPLEIDVQNASVQQLVISQSGNINQFKDIRLHAKFDQANHALTLEHAVTPYGLATGALQLRAVAPFDISGIAELKGNEGGDAYQINARLSGTLQALGLELDAKGKQLDGQASIDVTPFAAVPVRRALIAVPLGRVS